MARRTARLTQRRQPLSSASIPSRWADQKGTMRTRSRRTAPKHLSDDTHVDSAVLLGVLSWSGSRLRDRRRAARVRTPCPPVGSEDKDSRAAARPRRPRGDRARRHEARVHGPRPGSSPSRPRGAAAADENPCRRERARSGSGPQPHRARARGHSVPLRRPPRRQSRRRRRREPAGYQSNSWRQRRAKPARALSFSSGVLAPSTGLDPALKVQAERPARRGSRVRVRLSPAARPRRTGPREEAGRLGVRLLGPHDDHHKARLPVASLEAVAALPEVEWVGVSLPEQKLSLELAELRARPGRRASTPRRRSRSSSISSRGTRDGELPPAARSRRRRGRGVRRRRCISIARWPRAPVDRQDHRARLRAVRRADRLTSGAHDQSTPLVDADMIRPGGRSSGYAIQRRRRASLGILDTGFMLGTARSAAQRPDTRTAAASTSRPTPRASSTMSP